MEMKSLNDLFNEDLLSDRSDPGSHFFEIENQKLETISPDYRKIRDLRMENKRPH